MTTAERADRIRRRVLEAALASGGCHIGSSLSVVDVLAVLHLEILRRRGEPDGDRFLLSKGHAAAALYATLAETGVLEPEEAVAGYCRAGGRLHGHPERGVPGVEMTGGSLGHGLAIAVGMALAARADRTGARVYCLLGDGELNEGSVWEAMALASHLRLGNLTAIVDANGLQGLGRTAEVVGLEPLPLRAESFGWTALDVPGHDHARLAAALRETSQRPSFVIARTVKGHGVPFMEDELMWHYRSLKEADRERVLGSLRPLRSAA